MAIEAVAPHPPPLRVRCCSRCRAIYRSDFLRCPTDGAPIDEHDGDPLIETTLGEHYVIEACVGEGAMGRVYRARHSRLQRRTFAVKVLLGDLASTLAMRLRFAQEAEAASTLDHPNVVRVIDVGRSESGLLYLVMDFVDGPLLSQRIAHGPIAAAEVVTLARAMTEGLGHAHDRGLVHRDFKPDNVILSDGVPRIVDFGLAITVAPATESARLTGIGATVGTPAYAAPEQARLGVADHRADLFALGVTMYEMLAGILPYAGNLAELIYQNATAAPPPIGVRAPGVVVPPWLEVIVRRLMAHDPDARFGSAAEVIAALDRGPDPIAVPPPDPAFARTDPVPIAQVAVTVPAASPSRRPWLGPALLAAGVIAGAAVVLGTRDRDASPAAVVSPTPSAPGSTLPADPAPPPIARPVDEPAPVIADEPRVDGPAPAQPSPRDPSPREPRRIRTESTPAVTSTTITSPALIVAPAAIEGGVAALAPAPVEPAPPPAPTVTPTTPAPTPPRPASPPVVTEARVAITALDVQGSLSSGQVRRVTDRLASALAACYGPAATRAGRSPATAVAVRLVLDEDGRARDVAVDGGALPGLASCVRGVVVGARSAVPPDVGTVRVAFTVSYQPGHP